MRQCEACTKKVASQAREGFEPKYCGICASVNKMCPWCGGEANRIHAGRTARRRCGKSQVIEGDFDLGWHCLECDEYYGIEEDGRIL